MEIRLGFGQLSMAAHIACLRRTSNIFRQRPHQHGQTGYDWTGDVHGLCAEVAASRYLNLHWPGTLGDMGARDVGDLIDVRSCAPGNRLILHHDDPDEVPFVLAWVTLPIVALCGWLLARDGKRDEFWTDPAGGRPAFFVPAEQLHDMTTLRNWINAGGVR